MILLTIDNIVPPNYFIRYNTCSLHMDFIIDHNVLDFHILGFDLRERHE